MPIIMELVEHMSTGPMPAGRYLCAYDPEAVGGLGSIKTTGKEAEALRFPTLQEALETWKRSSRTRPWRSDGKPNRPLTAYTVTFKKVD